MGLIGILLYGALLVAIYVIADAASARIEQWRGQPLGYWRSVVFFVLFLGLLLLATRLMPLLGFGGGEAGP